MSIEPLSLTTLVQPSSRTCITDSTKIVSSIIKKKNKERGNNLTPDIQRCGKSSCKKRKNHVYENLWKFQILDFRRHSERFVQPNPHILVLLVTNLTNSHSKTRSSPKEIISTLLSSDAFVMVISYLFFFYWDIINPD